MTTNAKLANYLLTIWVVCFCLAIPQAVHAAAFSVEIRAYDFESLLWAAVMSLFGGTLRTIFTLATDKEVVLAMSKELFKDIIVAVIAGMLVYILLEAARAADFFPVPSELRFALIVFAGWSRMSFFGRLNQLGAQFVDALGERIGKTVGGPTGYRPAVPQNVGQSSEGSAPVPAPKKPPPFNEKG